MTAARCLPDDTLLALAGGALAAKALDGAQTHLDSCGKCRRLLVALSRTSSISESTRHPSSGALPIDLPVGHGTRIGRYVVTRIIGAGGMGAVYAAHDPDLERRVAIKLVHERLDQPEAHVRREARAMARLSHPNVVQIYDVGMHGARTYIAMELVEGRTLRAWVRETGPSTTGIVGAFVQAGKGLAAAHQAGLVHCDFKPDNVFVAADGTVKIGDFGLAHAVEGTIDAGKHDGAKEGACGTPAYLAPEVIQGCAPSGATDQFSFCVALWEALHGQLPFRAATPAALLHEARAGRVHPASSTRVSSGLRRAIVRGLAAHPGRRHPSMAALLEALVPS